MLQLKKTDILLILILIGLAVGCSNKKNTLMSRSFHNLTSHYNMYFNGYESFKSGLLKIDNSYKDNYTRILPIFTYGDKNNPIL